MDHDPRFDHAELSLALKEVEALTDPAETHGLICGFICSGSGLQDRLWLASILGTEETEDVANTAFGFYLLELYELTYTQLQGFQFDFQPLLPAETDPISLRVSALSHW